ncbi:conserved unknown protein [Ectocarpus siliculosus]|uniref:Uncharacterized protein n=1 Tax=Ectocarpus siliculosus TaxID=2880 RepID=D7FRS1_ECTSI|nr:conserved unknown protein [Ectocarpus siliculosus]|eukprot:CBJ30862.1 conserved unknown protein [Ectocarpus siliculosus]
MLGGPKHLLIAAMALLSMGRASSQCISGSYVLWYPCGTISSTSCDRAGLFFQIKRETNCVSSNPIVTIDFTGPIVSGGYASGSSTLWGDASDDQLSLTFDMGELDQRYSESGGYYYWLFNLYLDNCDTSYTWDDNFVQLSYVDDEQNAIDLSAFEDPYYIEEPDTGICPTPSPATPSPATPAPVTDATPAPTPAPTMRGAYCHGDPHCRTFDGLAFDCHGDGDFVLLNSADTGAMVHARFEPLVSPDASFTTGVAATEDGSSVIEVTVNDGERTILIDGEPYAYEGGDFPETMTGVTLTVTDQNVDMLFPSGLQVNARRWFTDPNYIGGVYVYAPLAMSTVGVLGTNNGNMADDWTDSTGETIGTGAASIAEGYNYCTSNWQPEVSLLSSPSRRLRRLQTSVDDYTAPVIPDVIPTDVEELCRDNTECIFDAIVVGLDVGAATLEAGDEFETEVEAAGGELPTPSPTVVQDPTSEPTPSITPSPTLEPTPSPTGSLDPPTPSPTIRDEAPHTPSPTPSPVIEGSPLALGCYEDDREDRIMDDLALSDNAMTTELCELTCNGQTYFATQYGRECWCGSAGADYTLHGESTDCTYACVGDADQTCGGFDAANVYLYAAESTPSPTPSPTADDAGPLALGCYEDDREDRIMDDLALSDNAMTTELCEQTCLGNIYFATQYGQECWCGSAGADYILHGESADCTYACAGDADQTCGGFDAANVYLYKGESTPSPTPSPTADDASPLSLGCYEDDREDRIMDDLALSDNAMTTELCEQTCLGNTYFATQYGRECWCGSAGADYILHGESADCTYACAGDADQTCGGFDAANVYLYTGDDVPTTSSFVGCYQDESDARIMELALTDSSSMTKERCEAECTGNTYFGMQYGRECFCGGSSTDLLQHGESTSCDYECPGDSDQVCGGFYAMSVYSYS